MSDLKRVNMAAGETYQVAISGTFTFPTHEIHVINPPLPLPDMTHGHETTIDTTASTVLYFNVFDERGLWADEDRERAYRQFNQSITVRRRLRRERRSVTKR